MWNAIIRKENDGENLVLKKVKRRIASKRRGFTEISSRSLVVCGIEISLKSARK